MELFKVVACTNYEELLIMTTSNGIIMRSLTFYICLCAR